MSTILAVAKTGLSLTLKAKSALDGVYRNTATILKDAVAENYQDYLLEVDERLRYLENRAATNPSARADLVGRIDGLDDVLTDREALSILYNLGYEAAREAVADRRKMLASAAVGLMLSEFTIVQKARVERTLRELDPADVLTLYGLDRTVGDKDTEGVDRKSTAAVRHVVWLQATESREALVTSGCVHIEGTNTWGGGGALTVTQTGGRVLEVLRDYIDEQGGAPFEVPGRPPIGDDERQRASDAVAAIDGLSQLIARTFERRAVRYIPPESVSPRIGLVRQSMSATVSVAPPLLCLGALGADDAAEVSAMAAASAQTQSALLRVWAPSQIGSPPPIAYVKGSHDILRVIADDRRCAWDE